MIQYPSLPTSRFWLRPLLIAGLLLVSSGLTFVASTSQATLILYALTGAGLILISMLRPALGLTLAGLAGMIVPYHGPSGLNMTMIMVAFLLGLWLMQLVISRGPRRAASRPVRPLLAFVVIAGLAFGVGQLPWFEFAPHAPLGAQLGGLSIFVLSAGTFLLAAYQLHELRWLRRMTWAFLALAALYVVGRSVLPGLGLNTQDLFQPGMGAVFLIWLVAIAFSQAAYNRDLHPVWRLALGGLVLLTLYNQLFVKFAEKSGWMPTLICIAAVIGFRSWRSGLALLPVVGLLAWYLAPSAIGTDAYSLSTRLEAWSILAQIIKISPIWGLGFANYYWYTPLFPIQGYHVSFNSHNNYVDIVAQTGLIGLACFVWFLWQVGRVGWGLRKRVPAGFARAYVYGALGGLVGMVVAAMLGDWVLPFFYNIALDGFRGSMLGWLFLGGLVSLERMEFPGSERKGSMPKDVRPDARPGPAMNGRG